MAQVQQSEAFAKAAQDPLDEDFSDLDDARAQSDAANASNTPDDDQDDQADGTDPDGTDPDDDDEDDTDDDEDDTDPDGQGAGQFSKADGGDFVDAMPLLQAMDRKYDLILARMEGLLSLADDVNGLRGQIGTLAKAVQASAQGTMTIAKAIAPHADAPLPSKSRQARTYAPTGVDLTPTGSTDPSALFAKAEKAAERGLITAGDVSLLNGVTNSRGVEGARAALPQLFSIIEEVK
ncbi:hypothetical protein [Deinococcus sp. UR1]|uniref:hypothetical protein n=1 Tax=Deinococcus sp. UR1 TaxID=1704277 RepID=UPI001F53C75A|nr:hypothetical protein [Deinococcus sp. UR1]